MFFYVYYEYMAIEIGANKFIIFKNTYILKNVNLCLSLQKLLRNTKKEK